MIKEYSIPVVFDIMAETEIGAALDLREMLVPLLKQNSNMESWWMPNHPSVDHSDNETVLVFIDANFKNRQTIVNKTIQDFYDNSGHPEWGPLFPSSAPRLWPPKIGL